MKKNKFLSGLSAKLALAIVALTTTMFTSCEKENENNKESDIPMEQVSYKASNEIIVNPERGFYKADASTNAL